MDLSNLPAADLQKQIAALKAKVKARAAEDAPEEAQAAAEAVAVLSATVDMRKTEGRSALSAAETGLAEAKRTLDDATAQLAALSTGENTCVALKNAKAVFLSKCAAVQRLKENVIAGKSSAADEKLVVDAAKAAAAAARDTRKLFRRAQLASAHQASSSAGQPVVLAAAEDDEPPPLTYRRRVIIRPLLPAFP